MTVTDPLTLARIARIAVDDLATAAGAGTRTFALNLDRNAVGAACSVVGVSIDSTSGEVSSFAKAMVGQTSRTAQRPARRRVSPRRGATRSPPPSPPTEPPVEASPSPDAPPSDGLSPSPCESPSPGRSPSPAASPSPASPSPELSPSPSPAMSPSPEPSPSPDPSPSPEEASPSPPPQALVRARSRMNFRMGIGFVTGRGDVPDLQDLRAIALAERVVHVPLFVTLGDTMGCFARSAVH